MKFPVLSNGRKLRNAAERADLNEVVKCIEEYHINIDAKSLSGKTALHKACAAGNESVVQYLLNHQASVNNQDDNGDTPMHLACQNGHLGLVKKLKAKGGKPGVHNKRGENVLDTAEQYDTECYEYLTEEEDPTLLFMTTLAAIIADDVPASNSTIDDLKDLLDAGAQFRGVAVGEDQYSALHLACIAGLPEIVKLMLEYGAPVNVLDESSKTALHCACINGNTEVIRLLYEYGANMHATDSDGWEPFHTLCDKVSSVEKVRAFVNIKRRFDPKKRTFSGATALHLAAGAGHTPVVRYLLDLGLSCRDCDEDGDTPLHVALIGDASIDTILVLLQNGASPTARNLVGNFPLIYASSKEACELMIERSQNIDETSDKGMTPLMMACRRDKLDVAQVLLNHGADVHRTDNDEWTSLHFVAYFEASPKFVPLLASHGASMDAIEGLRKFTPLQMAVANGDVPLTRVLLEHGASVNYITSGENRRTALMLACGNCKESTPEIIQILVHAGADLKEVDEDGWTALHFAISEDQIDVVRKLLTFPDVDVNCGSNKQETPLHLASKKGSADIASLLLEKGAHPSCANSDKWTPLHLAASNGCNDAVKVLLKHSANIRLKNTDDKTPYELAMSSDEPETAEILKHAEKEPERFPFFDVLVSMISSTDRDFSGFNAKIAELQMLIHDVHEMRIFYTLVSSCLRSTMFSQNEATKLIEKALDITSLTCECDSSFLVFQNILRKALDDKHITQQKYDCLNLKALKTNIGNSKFIREIWDAINSNSEKIKLLSNDSQQMKSSINTLRVAVIAVNEEVCGVAQYLYFQKRVDCAVALAGAIAGALTLGVGGPLVQAAHKITENIVDFADFTHISFVITESLRSQGTEGTESGFSDLQNHFNQGAEAVGDHMTERELERLVHDGDILTRLGIISKIESTYLHGQDPTTPKSEGVSSCPKSVLLKHEAEPSNPQAIPNPEAASAEVPKVAIKCVGKFPDAELNDEDEKKYPIHAAIKYGFMEDIIAAITESKESLKSIDSQGRTTLDMAILTGQNDIAKMLKAKQVKTKKTKGCSSSTLKKRSLLSSEHLKCVREDLVSDIEEEDYDCETHSVHVAVKGGDLDDVKEALSESPIEINAIDSKKRTPLDLAMFMGRLDIAKCIQENGGKYNAKGKWAMSAIARHWKTSQHSDDCLPCAVPVAVPIAVLHTEANELRRCPLEP